MTSIHALWFLSPPWKAYSLSNATAKTDYPLCCFSGNDTFEREADKGLWWEICFLERRSVKKADMSIGCLSY